LPLSTDVLTKSIGVDYCAAQLVVIMLREGNLLGCLWVEDGKTGGILRMEEESKVCMQYSST